MKSPYEDLPEAEWLTLTQQLLKEHPLDMELLAKVVRQSWDDIFKTRIGGRLRIGEDIYPSPQQLGNFMHGLISLNLEEATEGKWRGDEVRGEKDLVYVKDPDRYSVEIKTSSNKSKIFGNRSYAQKPTPNSTAKSGYYLAVNFEKSQKGKSKPKVRLIRFGWLDHSDWVPQKSPTGNSASLKPVTYSTKLIAIGEGK